MAMTRTPPRDEDIQYHLYVQQKIARGLAASDRADFISDEEIEQRIARLIAEC
jgi:hypothetical protein